MVALADTEQAKNRAERRRQLYRATLDLLTNLAETDDLPMTVQMALLQIIETTGIQAGAIRLLGEESYAFADQENTADLKINVILGCTVDRNLKLFNAPGEEEPRPCMFNRDWNGLESFYCPSISRWHQVNSRVCREPWCEKCKEWGYETTVIVPVKTAGEMIGLIHIFDTREEAVSSDELVFLKTISSPLGYALKHLLDREALRRSEEKLQSSYDKLKVFSSTILRVQEEEKIRLSRELHDEVGQVLTAVKMNLQGIKKELPEKNHGFQERLEASIRLVDATLEQVRRQVVSLRPPGLDHIGLVAAVQNLVRRFDNGTGVKVSVVAGGNITGLSSEVEMALFRCIQESLTNVARHARAKNVTIEINSVGAQVWVKIEDDGMGFEQNSLGMEAVEAGHTGLIGMQERVELLNGELNVDSRPGRGTRITITVPRS